MDPSYIPYVISAGAIAITSFFVVQSMKRKPVLDPKNYNKFKLIEKIVISPNTALYVHGPPSKLLVVAVCVMKTNLFARLVPVVQHISVMAGINGKPISRSYTPTSSDDDLGHFDLVIKSYSAGNVSKFIGELKIGDGIDVRGPKGAFTYTPNMCRAIGMLAGGTGITPMLQIIRAVLKNPEDKTQLSLVFANVNEEDILLKKDLDGLAAKHDNFKVHYVLNNPPEGWTGGVGFVTKDIIDEHCPKPADGVKILLCGPPPMIAAMTGEGTCTLMLKLSSILCSSIRASLASRNPEPLASWKIRLRRTSFAVVAVASSSVHPPEKHTYQAMDLSTVYQLFVATYHPDPNVHKQAELSIRGIEATPGFLPVVLQILGSEESELGARQAGKFEAAVAPKKDGVVSRKRGSRVPCFPKTSRTGQLYLSVKCVLEFGSAIYFKNRLHKSWDEAKQSPNPINEQDRNVVKQAILQALITAPNAVKVQLTSSLNTILNNDFPDQWPDFLSQVQTALQSNDVRLIYVGLLALREVVKVYQWKSVEKRDPLSNIVKATFPTIQNIATGLVSIDTLEAAEMLKTALKIYHTAIHMDLPKCLQEPASLVPWGTIFVQLVDKHVPQEGLPADSEEREKYPWWKAKKWAYHCLNRLFGRYGNPAQLPQSNQKYQAFAKNFITNFAPNILHMYLKQIELWIKKENWMSQKCLALTAAFFSDSVKHKTTWQILKPHTETLVSHFIFPQLCFSQEDEELWIEDPVEYVHKKVDPLEDFHSPVTNAINFLIDLARDRKKHTFMGILGFANNILSKYSESPLEAKLPREKDGALCMIGCLAELILRKACHMTNQFSDLDFSNPQSVLDGLRDSELPVRVEAALALQPMIRHESELLNLTNEIDVDTLASVMEEFVEVFAEQLAPFAVQLCSQLVTSAEGACNYITQNIRDTFLRIMEDVTNAQHKITEEEALDGSIDLDEMGDKTMAAMGVLKTIGTLILSLESTPDVRKSINNSMIVDLFLIHCLFIKPRLVLTSGLSPLRPLSPAEYGHIFLGSSTARECFAAGYQVHIGEFNHRCTFSSKQVSPTMWSVFELIYMAFKESGIDFMDEMLPALDNYISYGREVFMTNENIQRMIFDIIETVMKSDRLNESDRVCACKLMEAVLLNCKGRVDQSLSHVINALYYNPLLTLRILEENQWTQGFFTLWFQTLEKFSRVHDKKLVIVALCSLLELPAAQLPASLQAGWSEVLNGIVNVFKTLPRAVENREQLEKLYEEGIDSEDDLDDELKEGGGSSVEGDADDEEVDEDGAYFLAANSSQTEDEESDEEGIQEEVLFESPLDEIDPYIRFENAFRGLQQHNPDSYTLLTKDLPAEQQNVIMQILSKADSNRRNVAAAR
ncbi:armadillo-type protein [Jimgerdemannia flammicorona]|uniref:Armadillo-type protein n=1 Tax=Jimgerdemannia flammicorona TaxID=994334 RepID=A0A433R0D4_9FUNG|nr:armadillo-type protein [Jimgerdemannia flammicorona]